MMIRMTPRGVAAVAADYAQQATDKMDLDDPTNEQEVLDLLNKAHTAMGRAITAYEKHMTTPAEGQSV